MIAISAVVGVAAAVANLSFLDLAADSPALDPLARAAQRRRRVRNSLYWPAILLLDLSAFVDLLFRLRGAEPGAIAAASGSS